MNSDELTLLALGIAALAFLVWLNVWAYRDRKKRGLTREQEGEYLRSDPFTWWP